MEENIEEFLNNLPTEVGNVVDKVLKAELEKLELTKPRGIREKIVQIIHEELKQLED